MKRKNWFLALSIVINIVLIGYMYLKGSQLNNAYSQSTSRLQSDLVQLEGAIGYQIENDWQEGHTVIEKIEDVRESINEAMVTGKNIGLLSKAHENDLWQLYTYFSKYPTYTGFPNTNLDNTEINELVELRDDLRSAGWGLNIGYSSDWDSLSEKILALIDGGH
jgi:hypothetical protein